MLVSIHASLLQISLNIHAGKELSVNLPNAIGAHFFGWDRHFDLSRKTTKGKFVPPADTDP